MKSRKEVDDLLNLSYRGMEKELGIKIRNGQAVEGIRKALVWVLD